MKYSLIGLVMNRIEVDWSWFWLDTWPNGPEAVTFFFETAGAKTGAKAAMASFHLNWSIEAWPLTSGQ